MEALDSNTHCTNGKRERARDFRAYLSISGCIWMVGHDGAEDSIGQRSSIRALTHRPCNPRWPSDLGLLCPHKQSERRRGFKDIPENAWTWLNDGLRWSGTSHSPNILRRSLGHRHLIPPVSLPPETYAGRQIQDQSTYIDRMKEQGNRVIPQHPWIRPSTGSSTEWKIQSAKCPQTEPLSPVT